MRRWIVMLLLSTVATVRGGTFSTGMETARSQTGQFVVSGRLLEPSAARTLQFDTRVGQWLTSGWTEGVTTRERRARSAEEMGLRLDPHYLVATAERIRQIFCDDLQLDGQYRGTVFIRLREGGLPDDEILVMPAYDKLKRSWYFKIDMPAEVPAAKLVRLLTEVLLLEAACRGAGPTLPEIPAWLSEGLVARLDERAARDSLFTPDAGRLVNSRPMDADARLRESIGNRELFSFEQLSWPRNLPPKPGLEQDFRVSAHALVNELLKLPGGGAALGRTVLQLPEYKNWQFAFLRGYQQQFPTLLAAEKWWAVAALHFNGQGGFDRWSVAESLRRLEALNVVNIERITDAGEEVFREEMALPAIVTSMAYSVHKPILERVVAGLFNLELRTAMATTRLVRDHRLALEQYLAGRDEAFRMQNDRFRPAHLHEFAVETLVKQLDRLAVMRTDFELLIPEPEPDSTGTLTVVAP